MLDDRGARYRAAGWWTGHRLVDRFAAHVAEQPDAVAVVSEGAATARAGAVTRSDSTARAGAVARADAMAGSASLTRSELWRAAGDASAEIGSAIGDRPQVVVIHLANSTDWVVMFLAVLRAGHVPATPPVTTSEAHLRHIFDLITPALVICGRADRPRSAHEAVRRAAAARRVAVAVADDNRLTVQAPAVASTPTARVPETTAHLMFTSSTTGPPKAVSHSEDTLATLNAQFAERFGLSHRTPVFMPSPLGHSVGAIHGSRLSLFLGAPLILQDEWDPQTALELVARHRAEFTAAATPFLADLVAAAWHGDEPKLAPLRSFLCGGAQVPPALMRRCRSALPNTSVTPLWGMTEGGLTTCVSSSTQAQREHTVGIGLPGLELRVLDRSQQLRTTGDGELVMRGPGVFNGYYGQPDLYGEHLVGDGFFRTGDLARIDADGYVSITGRLKDLIIRGAVNISPVETENAISAHADVEAVAVIGWPDDRLGERICAVVQARRTLDLDDIVAFCAEQGLSRRCWPERLMQVDSFPRTAAGKIRKQQLRDELVARSAAAGTRDGDGSGAERSAG